MGDDADPPPMPPDVDEMLRAARDRALDGKEAVQRMNDIKAKMLFNTPKPPPAIPPLGFNPAAENAAHERRLAEASLERLGDLTEASGVQGDLLRQMGEAVQQMGEAVQEMVGVASRQHEELISLRTDVNAASEAEDVRWKREAKPLQTRTFWAAAIGVLVALAVPIGVAALAHDAPAPSTTAPSTTAPSTTAPSTTAPSTTAPSTTAP